MGIGVVIHAPFVLVAQLAWSADPVRGSIIVVPAILRILVKRTAADIIDTVHIEELLESHVKGGQQGYLTDEEGLDSRHSQAAD